MGPRITSKPDRTVEQRSWSPQGEDPILVAALAAALVEYRRHVGQANGNRHVLPDNTRPNWRLVTRMSQLQRMP